MQNNAEQPMQEAVPVIINIFDKNVVPKIIEASDFLDKNDEESAKRIVCDMIRAGFVQLIYPTNMTSSALIQEPMNK